MYDDMEQELARSSEVSLYQYPFLQIQWFLPVKLSCSEESRINYELFHYADVKAATLSLKHAAYLLAVLSEYTKVISTSVL